MDPLETALEQAWRLHKAGNSADALRRFQAIEDSHPGCLRCLLYQAAICWELRRLDESERAILRALELHPRSADAWNIHGLVCLERQDREGARTAFEEAVRLDPGHAPATANLAVLHLQAQDPETAIVLLDRALALQPDFEAAKLNRASALAELGAVEAAIEAYRCLLSANSGLAKARYNLANLLLSTGKDWDEAWRLRENWWEAMERTKRRVPLPEWDGAPFPGRTLLLHSAQEGFGDMVFFARYAALAKARGGRVVLEAYPALLPLLRSCPGVDELYPHGAPLPEADLQALLSSLPGRLGTTLESIPQRNPYLSLPPSAEVPRRAELDARLVSAPGRKVGLVWAGDPNLGHDAARSIPLAAFAPLQACRGITFVLLQKRAPGDPPPAPPEGLACLDLGDLLEDFAATGYVLSKLESLVSVDTSVAHVAGALGFPVLLLLSQPAEWRWLRDREDSPWYPSLRLYRQPNRGDWPSVLERVASDLQAK
jgi:tetratricopeptide (TPR) repeat protein